jgi:hypothetical protein
LTFNGLGGFISQKIVLFISIAVTTSNLTNIMNVEFSVQLEGERETAAKTSHLLGV